MKTLFFSALLLLSATHIQAQKMNIIDYFNAFLENSKSPDNNFKKQGYKIIESNGEYTATSTTVRGTQTYELTVNKDKTFLSFKNHIGWKKYKVYPTFKIFTKADGTQILGVYESGADYMSYKSKYEPAPSDRAALTAWKSIPKPMKFWTYANGTWTEVTDQVMPNFIPLADMIDTKTAKLSGMTAEEFAIAQLWRHTHPLYEMNGNNNEIKVWIDGKTLDEFRHNSGGETPIVLVEREKGDLTKDYYAFLNEHPKFHTYYLVWDAQKGQFVRK